MHALIGCLTGAAAGLGAWWTARAWPETPRSAPATSRPEWRSARLPVAGLALWGAYAGWRTGHSARAVLAIAFAGLLLLVSLVDLRKRRIPTALLLPLLGLALVQTLWVGRPAPGMALLGSVVGGGLFFLLSLPKRDALGPGDIRLAAALGAMLGLPDILAALAIGILAGGVGALWLLATHRARRQDRMVYAPYLALGAWLVWTCSFGLWP